MATAMAMSAHTADSRPEEMPSSTVVAGPVRAALAISLDRLGLGGGEVLGDLAGDQAEDHAGDDGAEHAGAGVAHGDVPGAVPLSLPT